ncbi:porin [Paraburkholderia tropica]|uniref:porin n=1 Tax=Paraburkholderia tropica TaxID=92647 RepID=UPI002AB18387|nr:porin [Paraburkholderia tropica]
MKKHTIARASAILATVLLGATAAHAQSSVTLYGAIDEGVNFTSNAAGHHAFAMVSGDSQESMWGLKGVEDLGGGLSAIFTLENGFNASTGAANQGGRLFGRQAFVGLASQQAGTLTLGRQYDATVDLWSPFTAAGSTIGDLAAHPFDNDNADYDTRVNNAVKYLSPVFGGAQVEAVYGFSNSTGFADNRNYSAGVTWSAGSLSAAAAYMRTNNGGTTANGALGSDAVFTASSQQNINAGVKWTFSDGSNVGFAYSHVDVDDPTANAYVSDIGGNAWKSWKFDNFELNGQYFIQPDLSLAGALTYTHGSFKEAQASTSPYWLQCALALSYSLSKRTSVYTQGAWQHTNGSTGTDLDAAHIVGSADLSSSGNQMVWRVGLLHKF